MVHMVTVLTNLTDPTGILVTETLVPVLVVTEREDTGFRVLDSKGSMEWRVLTTDLKAMAMSLRTLTSNSSLNSPSNCHLKWKGFRITLFFYNP